MHLVEISTKSTKNMGYAQVTQSPDFVRLDCIKHIFLFVPVTINN